MIALEGDLSEEAYAQIKAYCVNPVEARFASLENPETLEMEWEEPEAVATVDGFTDMDESALSAYREAMGICHGRRRYRVLPVLFQRGYGGPGSHRSGAVG